MATTIKKPAKNGRRKPSIPITSTAAAVLLLLAPAVRAADWRVVPSLDLRETYTDNVRLAPAGAERSDFITDISPGVSITATGPGLKLSTKYALQYLAYANDSTGSAVFHKLNAAANADLIKELLFLDATAAISQQSISPVGLGSTDNFEITGNRTTVKTATISPYLRRNFGGTAGTELRYTRTAVNTDADDRSSGRIDALMLEIHSGPAFRTWGWGLNHSAQKNRLGDTNAVDSATSTGSLRYMVTPQFYLTATGGYDRYDYATVPGASDPNGSFYTGGFSWRPTERTSVAASAGRRFFGRTYTFDSSVRSRVAAFRLSYNEAITTTPAQFGLNSGSNTADFLDQLFRSSIPDEALRRQAIERFMLITGLPPSLSRTTNFFSNQFFLQKTLQASIAVTGARNTVVFTASKISRGGQSVPDLTSPFAGIDTLAANNRQLGLNVIWNWRITPLTNAQFSADYARTKAGANETRQNLKTYRASLSRQFQPKLTGLIEFKHASQTSDAAVDPIVGVPVNSYKENAITAFLSMKF